MLHNFRAGGGLDDCPGKGWEPNLSEYQKLHQK